MKVHETSHRSLFKAITFRAIILTTDGLIIFVLTGSYDLTLSVILFSNLISTVVYFLHERAWNQIHWGRRHINHKRHR
ncbi:MAG: Adenylyl-sulfate kinase [Candidatus Gottesmanbacteria bacterium GW2011_GWA1_42_26]|nr:MAG: Adenylyl-sulfate kinase [Candidatus Gottesmanbacteria bacterium GW2011_GWA1_42_26]OGG08561.1 MAG: hypothetical protein A2699_00065 [Candidatus Gottesmanbacteria bacterium RIFCSPHIGHO2_01_FULL_43_15]OGG26543.1 MAG: hypothetical protein A3A59_05035 [Candidatus Gottesmanbacteria bacterium RIFCSPLOWO2_01_FULL_42_10]